MKTAKRAALACVIAYLVVSSGRIMSAQSDDSVSVLIRTAAPERTLLTAIQSLGGRVTYKYKHVDAIAAVIPRSAIAALQAIVGSDNITKDEIIAAPEPVGEPGRRGGRPSASELEIPANGAESIADVATLATEHPNAYLINNGIMNVAAQHAEGFLGEGVIVAVIDSGIRPGFPHISLDGSVVGCEDFVLDALGCSNFDNDGHGTFVAGMISANVLFQFDPTSAFRNAVLTFCPACLVDPPTNTVIPMIGSAPLSSIYALRVFGPTGGSPATRIIAAVDRAIELRQKFDNGEPDGVDIRIANLSLGGHTLFAGRDVFDMAIDQLLVHDIVPVISAGNAGPSSLTVGSPGTAFNALTIGAASLAHNERILRYLQLGPVLGPLYRPFSGAQTAFFSSRGPNADGRLDPDVVANGFASYGQGFGSTTNVINIASGTSFSAPSVAGVAAVLRQQHPDATARQIRNAIIMAANPNLLADDSTELDQGAGFVDAAAASALLLEGLVPDTFPEPSTPTPRVKVNIEQGTFLKVHGGVAQVSTGDLKPGQRYDLLYRVTPETKQVVISLGNVIPALPPEEQNQLFGDDLLFAVHSAKTSSIGEGDYKIFGFVLGGTFTINDPEPGVMRITINGDWTNAGTISADVLVYSLTEPLPRRSAGGRIAEGDRFAFPVTIPAGVSTAEFLLSFRHDWSIYPTSDIDLILVAPNFSLNFAGATLNAPERVKIANPMPGTWLAVIDGFEIHVPQDRFELRVILDGQVVTRR